VPSEAALQVLPAAIPGDVVDDLVLAVREAATNAILYGSCDAQPVKMTVRVQGGWIEATIRDRGRPIPRGSRDEPSRAWLWLIGQLVDELRLAKGPPRDAGDPPAMHRRQRRHRRVAAMARWPSTSTGHHHLG
jgi:anti-sigma regulatory factor (Ser/Thr protein kinase)